MENISVGSLAEKSHHSSTETEAETEDTESEVGTPVNRVPLPVLHFFLDRLKLSGRITVSFIYTEAVPFSPTPVIYTLFVRGKARPFSFH